MIIPVGFKSIRQILLRFADQDVYVQQGLIFIF